MRHGEIKDFKIESEKNKNVSHEYSISKRYCDACIKWVETKGVIGAICCPICGKSWTTNNNGGTND
jgi:hypothetical protein